MEGRADGKLCRKYCAAIISHDHGWDVSVYSLQRLPGYES